MVMMNRRSVTASGKGSRTKIAKALSFHASLRAIRLGTADEFEELRTQGVISNINMRNAKGETLLMFQCINHSLKGVKLLLSHSADVNITDAQGNSALTLACRHYKVDAKEECAEITKLLAAKDADLNMVSEFLSSIRGYQRGTALFEACITNRLDVVSLLLELGAAINYAQQNPLIEACFLRNMDIVKLFITHGADVNIIDNRGRTSLGIACQKGFDELVELLLDNGADMNLTSDIPNYKQPIVFAYVRGRISTVKLLLDRGVDVNLTGNVIPLIVACQQGKIDIVRLLLERGADTNVVPIGGGFTPLIEAAAYPGMIDLLLEYGADINAESGVVCALNYACIRYQRDNVILLLERGADLYREDGITPIAYTTHGLFVTDPEIAALVVKYGESNKRAYREVQPLLK